METDYPFKQHDIVPPEDLTLEKARALAEFLQSGTNPFARLAECRAAIEDGAVLFEVVVLDVDVEVSQHPVHDIRQRERLAVGFSAGDMAYPEVLALREDFPTVPHLNLRPPGFPPSLCLYDQPFDEVRLDWRVPAFVERVRYWLAQTASGQLHAGDQPLEPLLFDPLEDLVLPEGIAVGASADIPEWFSIRSVPRGSGLFTAIAERLDTANPQLEVSCIALVVSCPPQMHGVIRHLPRTLEELHDFVASSDLDLLDHLRGAMGSWMQGDREVFERVLDARLVLIVLLPKTRAAGNVEFEAVETRAFAVAATVREVGVDIGLWDLVQGEPGLLLPLDKTKRGGDTAVVPLNPRAAFTPSLAASVNGLKRPSNALIAAIGVGALGSQVVCNLVRAGFGKWTLIDDDVLLPHNLGRHSLYGSAIGFPKATALAEALTGTVVGERVAEGIVANVIHPGESAERVQSAFSEADTILDMSASVPVARHLSHDLTAKGRRMSLFLNPSGTALTLLAEDPERRVPLDVLEMQSYRAIVTNPELSGLLDTDGRLRTGQSCRDLSARIPQDLVALHAAIGSRAVRVALSSDFAQITTWRVGEQGYEVSSISVDPAHPTKEIVGDWIVYTDSVLRAKLSNLRQERLPRETGGVLIGAYDMQRKIIYIVDTVASPPDSEEWPTAYIRGTSGLNQRVQEMSTATAGMLRYVGEWHSHPDGCGLTPSRDDRKVLAWLGEISEKDGTPGVVAIVGDEGKLTFHLGVTVPVSHE